MSDAHKLVDDLHDLVESHGLPGLGVVAFNRENTELTVSWKRGNFPPEVIELCERSGVKVQMRASSFAADEVNNLVTDLVRGAGSWPFRLVSIGPSRDLEAIVVEVVADHVAAAEEYFAHHDARLPDGNQVEILIHEGQPVRGL